VICSEAASAAERAGPNRVRRIRPKLDGTTSEVYEETYSTDVSTSRAAFVSLRLLMDMRSRSHTMDSLISLYGNMEHRPSDGAVEECIGIGMCGAIWRLLRSRDREARRPRASP
jgi:hypothetical protein